MSRLPVCRTFPLRRVAMLAVALAAASCRGEAPPGYRPSHPDARHLDIYRVRFDDGDTFLLDGKPVRILGIDTPEVRDPDVGILEDQPYGVAAAETTRALMTRARLLEWAPDGRDIYGRRLAHVLIDGKLLAVALIERRLAYENVSYYGDNGYPDFARQILDASMRVKKPPFETPYKWRQRHQQKAEE